MWGPTCRLCQHVGLDARGFLWFMVLVLFRDGKFG